MPTFREDAIFFRKEDQPSSIFQLTFPQQKTFATLETPPPASPCETGSVGRISRQVQHPCGGRVSCPIFGSTWNFFRHLSPVGVSL